MAESGIKLLIVDDEFNTRQALMRYLGRKFEVTGAENGSEAIEQLKEHDFALVLTDLRMPEADGMSVLDAAKAKANPPKCIMLTAYGSISEAVTAMKKGAFDFVRSSPETISFRRKVKTIRCRKFTAPRWQSPHPKALSCSPAKAVPAKRSSPVLSTITASGKGFLFRFTVRH